MVGNILTILLVALLSTSLLAENKPWYQEYFDKMPPATVDSLKQISKEFNVTRNPRIMAALFKEDLEWMQRGYSNRQLEFMVAVVVDLAIVRANKLLNDAEYLDGLNGDKKRVVEKIKSFISLAPLELERRRRQCEDMKDYELVFYY